MGFQVPLLSYSNLDDKGFIRDQDVQLDDVVAKTYMDSSDESSTGTDDSQLVEYNTVSQIPEQKRGKWTKKLQRTQNYLVKEMNEKLDAHHTFLLHLPKNPVLDLMLFSDQKKKG